MFYTNHCFSLSTYSNRANVALNVVLLNNALKQIGLSLIHRLSLAFHSSRENCKRIARVLQEYCKRIARVLQEYCKRIARELQQNYKSIAKELQEYCKRIAREMQEKCKSIARELQEDCKRIARVLPLLKFFVLPALKTAYFRKPSPLLHVSL